VVLLKEEKKKNNKEKENPTHSVSDGGSWTLGSKKVPKTWGKPTGGLNNAMGIKDSRRKSLTGRMEICGSTGG